jgi:hypothetical protein
MNDDMTNLEDMTREQLIGQIMYLRKKISRLEDAVSDMGWQLNPDRMGGQFTDEEIARAERGGDWR